MRTEKTNIERTVYVYAEAKTSYQINNLKPGEMPFEYKVKGYDFGDEKSVRIMEQQILVTIPEGIDITLECVKNLQEKIEAVRKEAAKEIKELEERIRSLTLIEYKPLPEDESDGDEDLPF